MPQAIFYSDQVISENAKVDVRLAEIVQQRGNRIGYIPSGPEPDFRFFNAKSDYYKNYDLELLVFYDLDAEREQAKLDDLLSCNAIHLSGGDTKAFLLRLRRSGMFDILRNWTMAGGILIGTSAGALLMTPSIALDALFSGMRPEESEDQNGLDLVPFEFFPHAQVTKYSQGLLEYSRRTSRPIVACSDGEGVIVSDQTIECYGNPKWLYRGEQKTTPQSMSDLQYMILKGHVYRDKPVP